MARGDRHHRRSAGALIALTVALATLVALALPALAAAAPAAPPCQRGVPRPLVVTNFGDSPASPLPGTLRYLVETVACPGETISFANHTQVRLADVLYIERAMTITGGAVTGGKLIVQSSDVTLSDLSLSDTPILIGPGATPQGTGGLRNVSVLGSLLAVNNPQDEGAIMADHTDNLVIGGAGAAGNHIQTLTKVAVDLSLNGAVRVVGNTFDAGLGGSHNIAINEVDSTDLLVRDNTSNGDFFLEPQQGQVLHNTIDESGAVAARASRAHVARGPKPTPLSKLFGSGLGLLVEGTAYTVGGHVLVDSNVLTNAGIQTDRENIDITSNRVSGGATGLRSTCGSREIENRGPIKLLRNTVTDTIPGLGYICTIRTPVATIAHNVLRTNDARGMELTTKRVAVTANQAVGSGTKGSPRGVPAPGIQVNPPGGQVTLTDNSTQSNTGDGVLFMARTIASMAGGDSHVNGLAGAFVSPGARVRISRTSFLANQGPGIDLDPRGVTPNGATKNGNHSLDWPVTSWDPGLHRIRGVTCGGCLVEGFVREPPPRTGNPNNGEGQSFVADVVAARNGKFVWPPVVPTCEAAQNYTFTATRPGPRAGAKKTGRSKAAHRITSEFNPPPGCPGTHRTTGGGNTTTGGGRTTTGGGNTTTGGGNTPTGGGNTTTGSTNTADGGQCPSSGQTCTGQGASCDSGAHCTGPGSSCGPGATCSGQGSSCTGGGSTCTGANDVCVSGASCSGSTGHCTSGSTCSGAQSVCTGSATCSGASSVCSNGASCSGASSVCQSGATCRGASGTCHGSGTTCSGSGSSCDTQSGCTGPASACTGNGTTCWAGDLQSTCTQGAECTKDPPTADFPPCPGPGQSWAVILDTFIPNGVFADAPQVTTLAGAPLPQLCTGGGFSQSVSWADHPEIQGTDPIDMSTIPPGRHVYRVQIGVSNAANSGTPGGSATTTAGAIGRAFWHTG